MTLTAQVPAGLVRRAWRLRICPGTADEYRRRHQAVWPEMLAALRARGRHNYSIFLDGEDLFLYAEVDPHDRAASASDEAIFQRWQAYMADILVVEAGGPKPLEEVFHLD